jgi:chlorite dismutase
MENRFYTFAGGVAGPWKVVSVQACVGAGLETPGCVQIYNESLGTLPEGASWMLRGVTSNQRYVNRAEQMSLVSVQPPLGRPEVTCAALIPILKTAQWWAMTQEERREIFEECSSHIAIGLRYLPEIARKLHHCRDLGEPFDFLTWFEFAPADGAAFEDLLAALRVTEEWKYVEREVDIRLVRGN